MPEKQFFNPYKPPKNMHVCCDRESLCLPTQLRDALNGHMTFNDSSGSKGPARSTMALRFGASCFFLEIAELMIIWWQAIGLFKMFATYQKL